MKSEIHRESNRKRYNNRLENVQFPTQKKKNGNSHCYNAEYSADGEDWKDKVLCWEEENEKTDNHWN